MAGDRQLDDGPPGDEEVLPQLPPLQVEVVSSFKSDKPSFPPRVGPASDALEGPGVLLRPRASALGSAGRQACASHVRATGVWRGTLEAATGSRGGQAAAAARLAPVLAGVVALDCCGVLADSGLAPSFLTFTISNDQDNQAEKALSAAVEEIGPGKVNAFRLSGLPGQVLSHSGELWLSPQGSPGTFEALLRLRPLIHVPDNRDSRFTVARQGPYGVTMDIWKEVAMVEFPRLLRIMMSAGEDAAAGGMLAKTSHDRYLVEEEDEILVINAWQQEQERERLPTTDSLSIEQLLWCEALRALGETSPCAEALVPAARLRVEDEGVSTRAELLDSPEKASGVDEDDAPRLSSLAFLRQYVKRDVLEEEVLPRLLPTGQGCVRVFSARLEEPSTGVALTALRAPKAKSIDDLFREDLDFRKPSTWDESGAMKSQEQDPLSEHELTSVMLVNETSGSLLAFHSLQAPDPCAI